MVLLFWRGKGYLVILAIFISLVVTAVLEEVLGLTDATFKTGIFEFIMSAIIFIPMWIYGKKWNAPVKDSHTLFGIPMQNWAIIYPVITLFVFILHYFKLVH